jgi:hypothetical protein
MSTPQSPLTELTMEILATAAQLKGQLDNGEQLNPYFVVRLAAAAEAYLKNPLVASVKCHVLSTNT